MMEIVISKYKKPDKQFDARVDNKTVPFGEGVSDYTIKTKSEKNYMLVGIKNEGWTKSGVKAAGWMGKHVLWNKPTLQASVAGMNKEFEMLNVKMKVLIVAYSNGKITNSYSTTCMNMIVLTKSTLIGF